MAWQPDYATVAELRDYARTDVQDDTFIGLAITAASRAIDRTVNRQFGIVAAPELRMYEPYFDRRRRRTLVDIDDLFTETGLVVEIDGTAVTDFELLPLNAAQKGQPWIMMDLGRTANEVDITATWGWASVPIPIQQATLLQGLRLLTRRQAPFGVAGSPEIGSEMRLLERLDPDVAVAVGPFTRWWAAA